MVPTTSAPTDQPVLTTGDGLAIPRLGFGTWQLGDDTQAVVEEALALGVRHLDGAQMYGNEAAVGAAIAASGVAHDELFVTTKIANDHHDPDVLDRSMDESLGRLGLEAVDLALVHWPVDWDRVEDTLAALAGAHADGRARHLGVSNFTRAQLDAVVDLAPLSNLQVECHPFLTQDELRTWCRDHDWAFTAYSPLAQGEVFDDDTLTAIAADLDASPAQVALAWLLHLPDVVAIPRTANSDHLADNWAARDLRLDDATVARIHALDEGRRIIDPDFAPW